MHLNDMLAYLLQGNFNILFFLTAKIVCSLLEMNSCLSYPSMPTLGSISCSRKKVSQLGKGKVGASVFWMEKLFVLYLRWAHVYLIYSCQLWEFDLARERRFHSWGKEKLVLVCMDEVISQ